MGAEIQSLRIKGFKGFAHEITIDFTRKGKNLVLYGENGSGKSSIMEALKILFDSCAEPFELDKYKNIFLNDGITINMGTTHNTIIHLRTKEEKKANSTGAMVNKLITTPDKYNAYEKQYLKALSRSTTILSYRNLMKIYDIQTDEDLYNLFIRNIMAYYSIPPKKEKTLIQLLHELEMLKEESPRAKKRIEGKERAITNEINKIFHEIHDKWNEYIRILTDDDIKVECFIEQLGQLKFKIQWHGKDVRDIMNFLNEGRLNAIALGLFLAYYKKFNDSPYKLLLLDDVVIGLDMSLRLPLLDILQKDFEEEYQIIITTFDENWFNLMKNYLAPSKWEFKRLIVKLTDNKNIPFLIGIETSDYLNNAEKYYNQGDIPASALYVRLEFERLIKKYAEKMNVEIKFKQKPSEVQLREIWEAVKNKLPNSKKLCKRIDTYQSILLNPSVHYDQRPKYRNEVKYAIAVLKMLKKKLDRELKRKRKRVEI